LPERAFDNERADDVVECDTLNCGDHHFKQKLGSVRKNSSEVLTASALAAFEGVRLVRRRSRR
jgi:hypothetical protein